MPKQQGSPEREFYCHMSPKHQKQPDMQQISCFPSTVPRFPLLALELPGVHPPEPCHGAARVRGHGSYNPIGQRMEEVEAVERNQMPIRDHRVSVSRTLQQLVHIDALQDLWFWAALSSTGDLQTSAEHNIHKVQLSQVVFSLRKQQLWRKACSENIQLWRICLCLWDLAPSSIRTRIKKHWTVGLEENSVHIECWDKRDSLQWKDVL